MYSPELRPQLSQGDLFTQIYLVDSARPTVPPQNRDVLVLSHTCEILKPLNSIILVCAIRPLEDTASETQGNIRRGRVKNAMYLESIGTLPESFIDFRYIFRVDKTILEQYMYKSQRIASLDNEAQRALATFFYRFLVRDIPENTKPSVFLYLRSVILRFLNLLKKIKSRL